MLIGKHGGGHEYGYLLSVGGCLEGCAYRNFSLAKSYVSAYQTVHGLRTLHVCLDVGSGAELVGCVFVYERCFKLLLHISVG